MNHKIEKIKQFRLYLLAQISELTYEQLNFIPANYNNNIVWNLGHLITGQQNMCYVKASLPVTVEEKFFTPYLPGKKPEGIADEHHIRQLREVFITSIDQLAADYDKKIFNQYSPAVLIQKLYGFEVNNIDDALEYLLYHEGLHTGCILSMKRFL